MLFKGVAAGEEIQRHLLTLLQIYQESRTGEESFQAWCLRHEVEGLAARVEARLGQTAVA